MLSIPSVISTDFDILCNCIQSSKPPRRISDITTAKLPLNMKFGYRTSRVIQHLANASDFFATTVSSELAYNNIFLTTKCKHPLTTIY
jgi:hypothetical protein